MISGFPGYFLAMISFALMKFLRGMFPSFTLSKLFLRRISSTETYFRPVLSAIRFAIVVSPTPKGPRTIIQYVIITLRTLINKLIVKVHNKGFAQKTYYSNPPFLIFSLKTIAFK